MRKLAILTLGLMLIMPMVAQEGKPLSQKEVDRITIKAKTEWVIQDSHKLLLQHFHQRYQEDYLELITLIRDAESLIHKDMPEEAAFNEQLNAFVIQKPKEEKK